VQLNEAIRRTTSCTEFPLFIAPKPLQPGDLEGPWNRGKRDRKPPPPKKPRKKGGKAEEAPALPPTPEITPD
jgi:hypothetical protein